MYSISLDKSNNSSTANEDGSVSLPLINKTESLSLSHSFFAVFSARLGRRLGHSFRAQEKVSRLCLSDYLRHRREA